MRSPIEAPEQLVLDLPHREARGAEDFLVSQCNEAAVRIVDRWPDWPAPAVLIIGPAACGKTHLANVWRTQAGAEDLAAQDVGVVAVNAFENVTALIIEDIDGASYDETALFHLLNLSKENSFSLLLTARTPPGHWRIALPDLRSRLRSLPVVAIEPPDEALLKAVLVKLFNDRQVIVAPHVVDFIALRMERSMEWVQIFVDAVDKAALSGGRKVTRQLAANVLSQLTARKVD
ncbi:MAG: hypothetical protein ACR2OX_06275 [Methyloligellaceae bacterium]